MCPDSVAASETSKATLYYQYKSQQSKFTINDE